MPRGLAAAREQQAALASCSRVQADRRLSDHGSPDLHVVPLRAQCIEHLGREARLDREPVERGGARPERRGEMVDVPGRRVDGLLQVHAVHGMAQEEGAATTGPAGHRRACRTPCRARRPRRASEGDSVVQGGTPGVSVLGRPSSSQVICSRVLMREAERRNHRAGRQPAARGRGRHHVAVAVDHVDVAGVADEDLALRPTPLTGGKAAKVGSPMPKRVSAVRSVRPRTSRSGRRGAQPERRPGCSCLRCAVAHRHPALAQVVVATAAPSAPRATRRGRCRTRPGGRPSPAWPLRRCGARSPRCAAHAVQARRGAACRPAARKAGPWLQKPHLASV